jgi:hypothetical protein
MEVYTSWLVKFIGLGKKMSGCSLKLLSDRALHLHIGRRGYKMMRDSGCETRHIRVNERVLGKWSFISNEYWGLLRYGFSISLDRVSSFVLTMLLTEVKILGVNVWVIDEEINAILNVIMEF